MSSFTRLLAAHQAEILQELSRLRNDLEHVLRGLPKASIAESVSDRNSSVKKPVTSSPLPPLLKGDRMEDVGFDNLDGILLSSQPVSMFSVESSHCFVAEEIPSIEDDDQQHRDNKAKRKHQAAQVMLRRSASQTQSEMSSRPETALSACVRSSAFETIAAVLIITNAIFIGVEIELSTYYINQDLPLPIQVIGLVYTALFALELMLRVMVNGISMFWRTQYLWNLLDLFVVVVSLWETLVLVLELLVPNLSLNAGIGVISSLRIVRILRITRLIRNSGSTPAGAMKFLRALRTLIHSIAYTLKEVVWAGVFLVLIMYVFSLALTQGVVGYQSSNSQVPPAMMHYWGGIGTAMSACFMAVTGGISWEVAANPLYEISVLWWWLFIFYVGFTVFAVLNVMTGVFCQSAIKSAQLDTELLLHNMMAERDEHLKRIKDLFARLDNDGSGSLTLGELEDHLEDPAVQAYFASLDLSITDVWTFFKLLDSDMEAEISPDSFFDGCQRLKGVARSLDLAKLMHQSQAMSKKQIAFMNQTNVALEQIHEKLRKESKTSKTSDKSKLKQPK